MASSSDRADKLRHQLDKAIEKGRVKEAIAALGDLERLEPKEPRWPQRLGDLLRRDGQGPKAEEAYLRALDVYSKQGFLPQAVALAKLVVSLNPARAGMLDQIGQQGTRDLRRTLSGARRGLTAAPPAPAAEPADASVAAPEAVPAAPPRARFLPRAAPRVVAPPPPEELEPKSVEVDLGSLDARSVEVDLASIESSSGEVDLRAIAPEVIEIEPESEPEELEPEVSEAEPSSVPPELLGAVLAAPRRRPPPPDARSRWGKTAEKHQSFIGGVPLEGMLAAARALEPAEDVEHDEVRFSDVPEDEWVEVESTELEGMRPASATPAEASAEEWGAERLAALSGAALFAEVSPEALGALARAAQVVELLSGEHVFRHGEEADALYVIVEGTALVVLPWLSGGGIDLVRGQIFGEACLLQGGKRHSDVRAKGPLLLLRIARDDLSEIVVAHSEVHELLFDLLVQRRVANLLQSAPLFAPFDLEQRKELANMFEVRWAAPGVVLQERGKRSDGLYLLLVGEFAEVVAGRQTPVALGTVIGHRSLLSRELAARTIVAVTESVVLRMPAKRFGAFAVQFPPALAALATTEAEPDGG